MKILVAESQNRYKVNKALIRRLVRYFLQRAARRAENLRWSEVSVLLTDNEGIRDINRKHLGRDRITDVIAFHYAIPLGTANYHVGEIAVNVELAAGETPSRARPPRNSCWELALYLAHGCDHLCGGDDSTRRSRLCMLRREWRWLRAAEQQELLSGLIISKAPRRQVGTQPQNRGACG